MTILLFGIISTGLAARATLQQRGFCSVTGDISHSDHFTILNKFSPNCYNIRDKNGVEGRFCISPTTHTDLPNGTYFEYADYELRNGYADFTVPGAWFKKWDSEQAYKEANYESRR